MYVVGQGVQSLFGIQAFNLVDSQHGLVVTLLDDIQFQQMQVYACVQNPLFGQLVECFQQALAGFGKEIQLDVDVGECQEVDSLAEFAIGDFNQFACFVEGQSIVSGHGLQVGHDVVRHHFA